MTLLLFWSHAPVQTQVIPAQSSVQATYSYVPATATYEFAGVIAAQSTTTASYHFVTAPRTYAGVVAAQSGIASAYAYEPSPVTTLDAEPGIVVLSGSQAELIYTPIAPVVGRDTGGGMMWPIPQLPRVRVRPRVRVPVLVHRTIEARSGRVPMPVSHASMRYRAGLVATAGLIAVTAGPATLRVRHALVHTPGALVGADRAARLRFRRTIVAQAGITAMHGTATSRYRAVIGATAGRVTMAVTPLTSTKTKHPKYVLMAEDEEWLLLHVA